MSVLSILDSVKQKRSYDLTISSKTGNCALCFRPQTFRHPILKDVHCCWVGIEGSTNYEYW